MTNYIGRRVLFTVFAIFFIMTAIFFTLSLSPGSPAKLLLGSRATAEEIAILERDLGLDKPLIEQYIIYMSGVIKGDLGNSYQTGKPVVGEVMRSIQPTFILAVIGVAIATVISIPIGILMAIKQNSRFDNAITFITVIIAAVPPFVIALLLMILFAVNLKWLPTSGIRSWQGYILPVSTIVLMAFGGFTRFTRSIMLEIMGEDYIRTARAKGNNEKQIIWKHCLRNILIPIITMVGLSFAGMLGGAIIVESIFAIPGLGQLSIIATNVKDIPLVLACSTFMTIVFSLVVLLLDISYTFIDPRIKAEFKRG
jgi:peptide/nickel transport system permease protein